MPRMLSIDTDVATIEPVRSLLVAQLESYGGKAYGRLADTILAVAALFVVHLLAWCCMYARQRFDLTDDGQLSVALASRGPDLDSESNPTSKSAAAAAAAHGEGSGEVEVRDVKNSELHRRKPRAVLLQSE